MSVASVQRLISWSGVCRSLLGEKEEDRSSSRSTWDRTGTCDPRTAAWLRRRAAAAAAAAGDTFEDGAGFGPAFGGGGGGCDHGERVASGSCPREELGGRETRLAPQQRNALRFLCGNLAAFPPFPNSSSRGLRRGSSSAAGRVGNWPAVGAGGAGVRVAAGSVGGRATACTVGTSIESCPHHHYTARDPPVPHEMARVELPSRNRWRIMPEVNEDAGAGAGAVGGGADGGAAAVAGVGIVGVGNGGDGGGGGGVAGAGAANDGVDFPPGHGGAGGFPAGRGSGGAGGRGGGETGEGCVGATLLNAQPACGMGGIYWPTLYDITRAKVRQRERLRDCFRKFSRGQKLDVRDPSGVWMGAVVLWAPWCNVGGSKWEVEDEDRGGADGDGGGGGGGAGGGGGGGGAAGAINAALDGAGSDVSTPEWRRLLQLALLADGGHLGLMHANQAAAAAAAAAAGGGGNVGGGAGDPVGLAHADGDVRCWAGRVLC